MVHSSFSFAVNGYRDVGEDSLNYPSRPIPSGQISRHAAGILALALAALALALSLGPVLTTIALSTIVLK